MKILITILVIITISSSSSFSDEVNKEYELNTYEKDNLVTLGEMIERFFNYKNKTNFYTHFKTLPKYEIINKILLIANSNKVDLGLFLPYMFKNGYFVFNQINNKEDLFNKVRLCEDYYNFHKNSKPLFNSIKDSLSDKMIVNYAASLIEEYPEINILLNYDI